VGKNLQFFPIEDARAIVQTFTCYEGKNSILRSLIRWSPQATRQQKEK
jgi:hypothetical protein